LVLKKLITIEFKLNGDMKSNGVGVSFVISLGYSQDWKTNFEKSC
jgi:hypothetical protein